MSIPKHISFKNGFEFAKENIEWLYKEINNKLYPLILIKIILFINNEEKKLKIIFEKDNFNKIISKNNNIIIVSDKDNYKKILQKWIT